MTSRVVPAIGEVIAASRRASWFKRLDFPALGGPTIATAIPERRHHRGNDGAAAVQMQFGDILAGDAGGARKPQHQAVVELLAAGGIAQPDMARDPGWREFPGERRYGRPREGAGQADDRDRRA